MFPFADRSPPPVPFGFYCLSRGNNPAAAAGGWPWPRRMAGGRMSGSVLRKAGTACNLAYSFFLRNQIKLGPRHSRPPGRSSLVWRPSSPAAARTMPRSAPLVDRHHVVKRAQLRVHEPWWPVGISTNCAVADVLGWCLHSDLLTSHVNGLWSFSRLRMIQKICRSTQNIL